MELTTKDNQRQICQATQLTRVIDAFALLNEANTTRSQHLATFQGNVELWVADHQRKVNKVEEQLRKVRNEIQRIATRIPLLGSPNTRPPSPEPPQPWYSPARPSSTSALTAPAMPPLLPIRPALRSPIQLPAGPPTRRLRWQAILPSSPPPEPPPPTDGGAGARGRGPPQGLR